MWSDPCSRRDMEPAAPPVLRDCATSVPLDSPAPSVKRLVKGPYQCDVAPEKRASSFEELRVRVSESKWETLTFSSRDDVHFVGAEFVRRTGLKARLGPWCRRGALPARCFPPTPEKSLLVSLQ